MVEMTLRPRMPQRKLGKLLGVAAWLTCSMAFLVRFHGVALIVAASLDLAVTTATIAALRRSYRRTLLTFGPDGLTWAGLFRHRLVLATNASGSVVEAEVRRSKTSARRTHLWLLVNGDGRAEVSLNTDAWDRNELEYLRQRLGIPRIVITETLDGKALRSRVPGSVPWPVLHPIALTYLLIAIIVAAVFVAQRF